MKKCIPDICLISYIFEKIRKTEKQHEFFEKRQKKFEEKFGI